MSTEFSISPELVDVTRTRVTPTVLVSTTTGQLIAVPARDIIRNTSREREMKG